MKKITLVSLSFALIAISSCKKKDDLAINSISTTQKAFVVDFTATWCPPCGTTGATTIEDALKKHPKEVVVIAAHRPSSFNRTICTPSAELFAFCKFSSQPSFMVSGKPQLYYSSVEGDVETALKNSTPSVGIGIAKSISGTTMTIKTKTKFFSDIVGDYALAIYITEDGVVYEQAMENKPTITKTHDDILVGSATATFGEKIVSGSASKGHDVDGSYTFTIPAYVKNNDNLHVAAVLYKVGTDGKPTTVLNANSI